MAEFKDHFSRQSTGYGLYRPHYPDELFHKLAALSAGHQRVWDCGCGTGQAAHGLARHFEQVVATDASAKQIGQAVPHERIDYRVASAESSGLDDSSVDLVLVAQALHWFEFDRFYEEVSRVSRNGGILAVVAYGLLRIDDRIDPVVDHLYHDLLGEYWPAERRHIDNGYSSIPFPFRRLPVEEMVLQADWSFDHFCGYLETWSAVQRYRDDRGRCPIAGVQNALQSAWGDRSDICTIRWPLYLLIGQVDQS